jgi:branched-chain amino acid transport system substrate-binding protein
MVKKGIMVLFSCVLFFSVAGSATAGDTVKIGVFGDFSGPINFLGIPLKQTCELAVEEVNAAGGINGKKLELIALDDEGKGDKAVTMVKKAIMSDKVIALVGGAASFDTIPVVKVVEESRTVMMCPIALSFKITENHPKYIFRTSGTDKQYARQFVVEVAKKGFKKPMIVHDSGPMGVGLKDFIAEHLPIVNLKPHKIVSFTYGANDFSPQIMACKEAGGDVIAWMSHGPPGALFAKQMKQMGYACPIIGGDSLYDPHAIELSGGAFEGSTMVISIYDNMGPFGPPVYERYKSKFKRDPGISSMVSQTWDSMMILIDGLKKTDGQGGQLLQKTLENMRDYLGASGRAGATISFYPEKKDGLDGNFYLNYSMRDGKLVQE